MAATAAQNLVNKKEAQLDKVTEEAQKAATRMKEEMNSLTARHEAAWQRTADAVDRHHIWRLARFTAGIDERDGAREVSRRQVGNQSPQLAP